MCNKSFESTTQKNFQWGYDADVSKFFDRASQSNIYDQANELLNALERNRISEVQVLALELNYRRRS